MTTSDAGTALRGTVVMRISDCEGLKTIQVPDPEEIPRGIALSPGQRHLLHFVRDGLIPSPTNRARGLVNDIPEENGDTSGVVDPDPAASGCSLRALDSTEAQFRLVPEYSPRAVKRFLGKVSRVIDLGVVSQPRPYHFQERTQRKKLSPSKLRKKRLQLAIRRGNPFRTGIWKCCSGRRCFQTIGLDYCFQEFRNVNSMNPTQAKRYLISLYDVSQNSFRVKGQIVCAKFLCKAFGFSYDVQCSIKNTPKARGSAIAKSRPKEVKRKTKRVFIASFIRHLAKLFGDAMPNREQITLPVLNRKELWKECKKAWIESGTISQDKELSRNYFYRVWRTYAEFVTVRRNHGFTVCSRCEMLRSEMTKHLRDEEALLVLIDQHASHLRFIEKERTAYEGRQALAEQNPSKYCSVIIDGADQKNYGLPHFARSTKSDSGHKLKVKVVGVLEHVLRGKEQLSLFTMTEEYDTGENHIIEASHRILQRKKDRLGFLPPILFVQVDNCMRENKNRYFMSYFQELVSLGVFKMVQVSFLPIGHTHADIDQAFSSISTHLKLNDAITLSDLVTELQKCYSQRVTVRGLDGIINYSELCENTQCLNEVEAFSEYRYFRFLQKDCESDQDIKGSVCDVKIQDSDEWTPFPTSRGEGFLKFLPRFGQARPTKTKALPNLCEVNKCITAVEERVKDDTNIEELRQLRDRVFETREEPCHWKEEECFEMHGDYVCSDNSNVVMAQEQTAAVEETLRPNYGYDPDDFVAVVSDNDNSSKFWIGRVKNVAEVDTQNRAKFINVRWYVGSENDPWEAKYTPAWSIKDGEKTVYEDMIEVESVLVRFESLTTSKKLRVRDKKAIKQTLNEN